MNRALVLTYHAIEPGAGPLYVHPDAFERHLDLIAESGSRAVTASQLAHLLRAGSLDRPTVAVTFDDGIASVVRVAAPLLAERGLPATVFCVAGHLGGTSNWPSALPGSPRFELAGAEELAELTEQGFEIGCHGMTHAPLNCTSEGFFERELVDSRNMLECVVRAPVRAFAYAYGVSPTRLGRRLVEKTYTSGWTTLPGYAEDGPDPFAMPRVDAHYLRRPAQLQSALTRGLNGYFFARRVVSSVRRSVKRDYLPLGARAG